MKNSFGKITNCQICDATDLQDVLFMGYIPPVNEALLAGTLQGELEFFPANLMVCKECELAQLDYIAEADKMFPASYPYTSGTTKSLRKNFKNLRDEASDLIDLQAGELVVDIGANDGSLLENFHGQRLVGVEPTDIGFLAEKKGIHLINRFFDSETVEQILRDFGHAKLVTATNVFAHIQDVNSVLKNVSILLDEKGVFVSENHYFIDLIQNLQYDAIYHEHLRYYSLTSLSYLFELHDLEIFHAVKIPTHGGSIRVYACRRGYSNPRKTFSNLSMTSQLAENYLLLYHNSKIVFMTQKCQYYRNYSK